jgi:hypothetical protein
VVEVVVVPKGPVGTVVVVVAVVVLVVTLESVVVGVVVVSIVVVVLVEPKGSSGVVPGVVLDVVEFEASVVLVVLLTLVLVVLVVLVDEPVMTLDGTVVGLGELVDVVVANVSVLGLVGGTVELLGTVTTEPGSTLETTVKVEGKPSVARSEPLGAATLVAASTSCATRKVHVPVSALVGTASDTR